MGITTATCDLGRDGRSVELGYTSGFGGTSSAAPLMAGICALLLSANPDLTVTDIKNILRQSADKIGPAGTYDSSGHSDFYGYGRVNALRAVQLARNTAGQIATTPTTTPSTTPAQQPATTTVAQGRVASPTLNVRSGPSTSNAKVATLKQGDVVNLIERVGGWFRIGNGQFVSADYIQVLSAPGARKGKVISATLNVRTGPSTANPKVATLKLGALVNILEKSADGWFRIADKQWVLGNYVKEV